LSHCIHTGTVLTQNPDTSMNERMRTVHIVCACWRFVNAAPRSRPRLCEVSTPRAIAPKLARYHWICSATSS
jgi:hypothetical protein